MALPCSALLLYCSIAYLVYLTQLRVSRLWITEKRKGDQKFQTELLEVMTIEIQASCIADRFLPG